MSWGVVANITNVGTLAAVAVTAVSSAASTHAWDTRTTPESELEWCKTELHDIKTRINELSPDRRERLFIAAERKKCTSLEELEGKLQGLLDERCELELRAKHSSFWERNLPAILKLSQLRVDICELKDAVGSLKDDAWTTTTFHLKEDKARARGRSMTTDADTHATAQPSTSGNTQGTHVSGQPEEHPLDIMPPPPAHTAERSMTTEVPLGIA